MDAVALVERAILGYAVEEEGIERHVVFFGQPLVEPVELAGVFQSEIARRQHAGQPYRDAGCLELGDDGIEIALGLGGIERAQRIVGAQFDHHDVGLVGQHPVDPLQATGRGVARDAMIDDGHIAALGLQRRLEAGRDRLFGFYPVARGQAVAQNGELDRRALCMRRP